MSRAEDVAYRDTFGRLRRDRVRVLSEFALPGSCLETQLLQLGDGRRVIRKLVASRPAAFTEAERQAALDAEIRALARIGQRCEEHYPAELARMEGYNVDVREPFVLVDVYRGEPVARYATRLARDERNRLQVGVLRALLVLTVTGVVHSGIGLRTLRWDRRRVQLVEFEAAVRTGERRRPGGSAPERTADEIAGTGPAAAADDVRAAGVAMLRVALGADDPGTDPSPVPGLAHLLDGVLDTDTDRRVTAVELMTRMREDPTMSTPATLERRLDAARAEFDRIASERASAGSAPVSEPRGRRGLLRRPR